MPVQMLSEEFPSIKKISEIFLFRRFSIMLEIQRDTGSSAWEDLISKL